MSEHTKEPWFYELEDGSDLRIYSETNANIVSGCGCCGSPNCDDADARRIVAAVNACAGMPTDDLEEMVKQGGNVRVLADFANDLLQQRDTAWQELREIRQQINANPEEATTDEAARVVAQRDKLLAELEPFALRGEISAQLIANARAAIAEVKGSK